MSKIQHDVAVHKAITLAKGESIRDFTAKLREQGCQHLARKLNMTPEKGGAYLVEVFDGACVFEAYQRKAGGGEAIKFYAVKYSRTDGTDKFEFGETTEVERAVTFRPKQTGVTKAAGVPVEKPFPNEHAARQTDPGGYIRFRRTHPKGFPAGVDAIIGFKRGGGSEIQTLRFNAGKFTAEQAKQWCKEHNFKTDKFEAAAKPRKVWSQKDFWGGAI